MAYTNGRTQERGRARRGERYGAQAKDELRAQRQDQASAHTIEMHNRLGSEIERAVKETRFYDAIPARPASMATPEPPELCVCDQDSVAAVLEYGRGRADMCDLAVLDFASFTHPGGGYAQGSMAQEEALCSESFLYNVLKRFDGWYSENKRHNINCELYRDRALVVPKVRFERERYHSYADVIVAAAPNARRARANYHVSSEVLERAMRSRIRLVCAIADVLGHDKLVLGAFGCGVFGWDAARVAEMFFAELAAGTHVARKIIFAIPKGRDENFVRFEHTFANFPAPNEQP